MIQSWKRRYLNSDTWSYRKKVEGLRAGVELGVESAVAVEEFNLHQIHNMGTVGEINHHVAQYQAHDQRRRKTTHHQNEQMGYDEEGERTFIL